MTTEFLPSAEGRRIIRELTSNGEAMLMLARTGTHVLNPYHNLDHELGVVYWSYSCAINSGAYDYGYALDENEMQALLSAALFHDHNHSGGLVTDDINVKRASEFIVSSSAYPLFECFGRYASLRANIEVTEFVNGKFTHEPKTFAQRCIRDADLMSIYTDEGRHLLLGLFQELKIDMMDQLKRSEALAKNAEFLWKSEMFTPFGKAMKAQHLERSIGAFESLVKRTYPYQVSSTYCNQ